jgi:hypothetical protein
LTSPIKAPPLKAITRWNIPPLKFNDVSDEAWNNLRWNWYFFADDICLNGSCYLQKKKKKLYNIKINLKSLDDEKVKTVNE